MPASGLAPGGADYRPLACPRLSPMHFQPQSAASYTAILLKLYTSIQTSQRLFQLFKRCSWRCVNDNTSINLNTMASNLNFTPEDFVTLDFDPRDFRYAYNPNMAASGRHSWPLGMGSGLGMSGADERRSTPPNENYQQYQTAHQNSPTLLSDWPPMQQQPQQQQLHQYLHDTSVMPHFTPFNAPFQQNMQHQNIPQQNIQHQHIDYNVPTTQAALEASLQMDIPFNTIEQSHNQTMQLGIGMANWQDFENAMVYGVQNAQLQRQNMGSHSPSSAYLEVHSLPSSSSDHGWNTIDNYQNFEHYQQPQSGAIFNPGQTLHLRSHSDRSEERRVGKECPV